MQDKAFTRKIKYYTMCHILISNEFKMALPRETKPSVTPPPTPEERQEMNVIMGIGPLGFFVAVGHFNPNPPPANNPPAPR